MAEQPDALEADAQQAIDQRWMQHALSLAERAAEAGEVPVGAVIVHDGQLLAEGWNRPIELSDPTAHAEIQALRAAATKMGNYRLVDCDLYVTLEPCAMCAGAIITARIRRVVYGADDVRAGAAGSVFNVLPGEQLNHRCGLRAGLEADASARMLRDFFRARRQRR